MRIHPLLIVTAVGLSSFGAGAFAGYKVAERNLALRFEERLHHEISASTAYYEHVHEKTKKFATPEEAATALIKPGTILAETSLASVSNTTPEQHTAYHKIAGNYASNENEVTDPEDQLALQIMFPEAPEVNVFTNIPHVIDQETFRANETEWEQSTLTWYIVDGSLTDERDQIIEDVDGTVGSANLLKFGEGSSDSNVVHIRNPHLALEFEVVRHEGSYRLEVLGIEDDPPRRPSGRG